MFGVGSPKTRDVTFRFERVEDPSPETWVLPDADSVDPATIDLLNRFKGIHDQSSELTLGKEIQ